MDSAGEYLQSAIVEQHVWDADGNSGSAEKDERRSKVRYLSDCLKDLQIKHLSVS